jgi:uncharacterized Fe-S cluster protein YjdI
MKVTIKKPWFKPKIVSEVSIKSITMQSCSGKIRGVNDGASCNKATARTGS